MRDVQANTARPQQHRDRRTGQQWRPLLQHSGHGHRRFAGEVVHLAENARKHPDSSNLTTIDSLLLMGGGVPVKADGDVIGAIGVGGAGGAVFDEACAIEAIGTVLGTAK